MSTDASTRQFTLTDGARAVVLDALVAEASSEELALWVEVTGIRGGAYAYDLYFSERSGAPADAIVESDGEITVVIPAASIAKLTGASLDVSTDGAAGLVLVNPNVPTPEEANPGVPAEILAKGVDSDLAKRAIDVLEHQVNPQIASHGGRADLVALDDERFVAYVRMSGGCQGCALSRMTLSQGIETTLKEEIPELVSVVDVTDHASGENPFYDH